MFLLINQNATNDIELKHKSTGFFFCDAICIVKKYAYKNEHNILI